jgi:hypothetical protein
VILSLTMVKRILIYLLPTLMCLIPSSLLCLVNGYISPEYIAVFCLLILLNVYGICEGYTSMRYLTFFGVLTLDIYSVREGYISWGQSVPIAALTLVIWFYTSDSKYLMLGSLKAKGSFRKLVINTVVCFLPVLQRLRIAFRREVVNVIYRKIGDRRYAEVQINDGSRKGKIYIPLIPTTCEVQVSESNVSNANDVPYTTFQSSGCIWSVPTRPCTVGCKELNIHINNREDKTYSFAFNEKDMVDLNDIIERHKAAIALNDNVAADLADAYD